MRKALPVLLALALVVALPLTAFANTSIIPTPITSVTTPLSVEWEITLPASGMTPDFVVFHDNASSLVSEEQIPPRPAPEETQDIQLITFDGFSYEEPNINVLSSTYGRYHNEHTLLLWSNVTFDPNGYFNPVDVQSTVRSKPFILNRDTAMLVLGLVHPEYGDSAPYEGQIELSVIAFDTEGMGYPYERVITVDSYDERFNITPFLSNARSLIPQGKYFAHFTIEAYCSGAIPTLASSTTILGTNLAPDVRTLTDTIYNTTKVDYSNFDLLGWLGASLDGFINSTIFTVGSLDVTIGKLVGSVLGFSIFIAFVKKFAGG